MTAKNDRVILEQLTGYVVNVAGGNPQTLFASPATNGQRPRWPDSMLADYIRPIAAKAGKDGLDGTLSGTASLPGASRCSRLRRQRNWSTMRISRPPATFTPAAPWTQSAQRKIVWSSSSTKQQKSRQNRRLRNLSLTVPNCP